jgi:hypothetical protein
MEVTWEMRRLGERGTYGAIRERPHEKKIKIISGANK